VNKKMNNCQKKVLHIMGQLNPSGMERMFTSSANLWEKFGWEPVILGQGDSHPYSSILKQNGYKVLTVRKIRSIKGTIDLVRNLIKINPEVIHIHVESIHGIIAVLSRLTRPRIRIVQTVHSVFEFDGVIEKRRKLQHKLSKIVKTRFVSVSRGVADNERNNYQTETVVVENWVASEFMSAKRKRDNIADENLTLALVGNCSKIKNHKIVLNAIMHNSKFTVIHIGSEEYADHEERKLFEELESSPQLIRMGQLNEVTNILKNVDLIAIPSKTEGFSVVLAEALCMGIPAIISKSKGMEWAREFPNVLTVDDDLSWQSVLDSLNRSRIVELQKCAEETRFDFLERFSASRGVSEYIRLYQ
jgi:glycosyltransferase involved in cell wall biosynthesis